jgi:PilX N-terminal
MTHNLSTYRPSRPGSRIRRLAAREEGITLILTVVIIAILLIMATSAVGLVASTEHISSNDRQSSEALAAAEAGLDYSANQVVQAESSSTQPNGSTLTGSQVVDGSNVSWTATKAADGSSWTITVRSVSPNAMVTRELQEELQPKSVTTGGVVSPVYGYGYVMADPSADCTVISGSGDTISASAQVDVPTWIASSLCLTGGSSPLIANPSTGSPITLYVGGKLQTSGNTSPVGTSTSELASATVVGGCQISFHGWQTIGCDVNPPGSAPTNGNGSGVWANSYSSTPVTLTKPTIDAPGWYQNAQPGPMSGCNNDPTNPGNVSSYPSNSQSGSPQWTAATFDHTVFDGNSTRDTSVGTIDPLQLVNNWNSVMNSFDCRYYAPDGTLVGRLAWTYPSGGMTSSNPGTLTVQGTVFIDGNLSFASSDYAIYQGQGTIYVNGTVSVGAGAKICAQPVSGSACQGNYDPSQNLLEIVAANAQNAATAWNVDGAGIFEGIAFANGRFVEAGSGEVAGPVIADTGQMSGAAKSEAIVSPPPGAPGASTSSTTTTWSLLSGSWRECPSATGCP